GDTVLDPFMGSGTTIRIAKSMRRNGIGIELLPEYFELAESEIAEETPRASRSSSQASFAKTAELIGPS
ncbi:MAG: site-specific DNA-methyltransferase, partial [Chloroflexi bacterium]|nr:site-specific DNA-methyltransferase [Chloroflexota bacterium]